MFTPLSNPLVIRQTDSSGCVVCQDPPPCSCAQNEQCIVVNRDCQTCSVNKCVPLDSGSSSRGVSAGAVAGAVIAAVFFLIAVILAFLWYRRRSQRAAQARAAPADAKTDTPARAEDVLNRPDPNEKPPTPPVQLESGNVRVYGGGSITTINLDPQTQGSSAIGTPGHGGFRASTQSNPFEDNHSILTTSTGNQSNVIPIALVGPGSASARSNPSQTATASTTNATAGTAPVRPARDSSVDLSLDTNGGQPEPSRTPASYAQSTRSGYTNYRDSYMTTGTYATDLFTEAPIIVTPTHGTIKQVLGTAKAEVIRTSPSAVNDSLTLAATSADNRQTFNANKPAARSPLAASSFGPSDLAEENNQAKAQELAADDGPFGDEHSPYLRAGSVQSSPAASARSFNVPEVTPSAYSNDEDWSADGPQRPWNTRSRPDSVGTQAQSIIGATLASATRVNVGLNHLSPSRGDSNPDTPVSATLSTPRTPYRMTSAKLVAPQINGSGSGSVQGSPASAEGGAFEMQQRRAMEELDIAQRARMSMSRASVVSSASTKADSILEGFPFVPPSPISDRPVRTPPRSPLAHQAFSNNNNNNNRGNNASAAESGPPSPGASTVASTATSTVKPLSIKKGKEGNNQAQTQAAPEKKPHSNSDTDATTPATATTNRPKQPQQQKRHPRLPPPASLQSRKVFALSTASESSTASNGLGSFPFQIDADLAQASLSASESSGGSGGSGSGERTPSSYASSGKQRASLDTLALTSDLSSYPLGFDKNIMEHYPGAKRS